MPDQNQEGFITKVEGFIGKVKELRVHSQKAAISGVSGYSEPCVADRQVGPQGWQVAYGSARARKVWAFGEECR